MRDLGENVILVSCQFYPHSFTVMFFFIQLSYRPQPLQMFSLFGIVCKVCRANLGKNWQHIWASQETTLKVCIMDGDVCQWL